MDGTRSIGRQDPYNGQCVHDLRDIIYKQELCAMLSFYHSVIGPYIYETSFL